MRKKVLAVLLCAVCALCLGAEVEEVSKGEQKLPGHEVWDVRETMRWRSSDGERHNQTREYWMDVYLDSQGYATQFVGYDLWDTLWVAHPPQVRLWNDTGAKRPYAVFDGTGLVGQLKLNRTWTRANGKITYSDPSLIFGISWYGEGRVRARYNHYVP